MVVAALVTIAKKESDWMFISWCLDNGDVAHVHTKIPLSDEENWNEICRQMDVTGNVIIQSQLIQGHKGRHGGQRIFSQNAWGKGGWFLSWRLAWSTQRDPGL